MKIDGYVLYEPVGFGAKGPVWRSVDRQGRMFALQVLGDSLPPRLEDRIAVLRKLDSPNVLRVEQLRKTADGRFVILYEFLEGQNLEVLRAGSRLGKEQLNLIGRSLAHGLADLHAVGLIHGDISPANAMVTSHGRVVWVDVLGSQEGTTLTFNDSAARDNASEDIYAFAQMMLSMGMESDLLQDALQEDPRQRPTADAIAKSWERLPSAGVRLLSANELTAAKMRAAGRDVATTRVGKRRQRLTYENAQLARAEHEPVRIWSNRNNKPGRNRALKIAIPGLTGAAIAMSLVLVIPKLLPLASASPDPPANGVAVQTELPEPGEILETSPKPANRPDSSSSLPQKPQSAPPHSLLPSASSEMSTMPEPDLLQSGKVATDSEAQAVMQEILNRRDRAIMAGNTEALKTLTENGSIIQQSDMELLNQLRSSGTKVSGLATAVKSATIVEAQKDQIRLRVTLLQGAYTQTDRIGTQHQIPALREVQQEITLLSRPWRIVGVVRLD